MGGGWQRLNRAGRVTPSRAPPPRTLAPWPPPSRHRPRGGRSPSLPKPRRPPARHGGMVVASTPPTGRTRVPAGSTARRRAQHGGARRLGGEQFQPVGTGGQKRERLGRGEEPGHRQHAARLGRHHEARIGVRRHQQPAAGVGHRRDLFRGGHGTGTDQQPVAELPRQQCDALQRAR